jgi:hypothetical protein
MEKFQIALDSLALIKKMLSGEMTTEEKYLGMMELDKKYPGIGFYEKAQEFANKYLRKKGTQIREVRDKKLESTGEEVEVPF